MWVNCFVRYITIMIDPLSFFRSLSVRRSGLGLWHSPFLQFPRTHIGIYFIDGSCSNYCASTVSRIILRALKQSNQLLRSLHETNRVCYLRLTLTGSSVVNAFVSRKIGKSETQGETWIRIGRIITVSFSSDAYVPFKTRLRHSQIEAEEPTSHTTSSVTIR